MIEFSNDIKEILENLFSIPENEINQIMNDLEKRGVLHRINKIKLIFLSSNNAKLVDEREIKTKFVNRVLQNRFDVGKQYFHDDDIIYEITAPINGKGEIIVEIPGITDIQNIHWKHEKNLFKLAVFGREITYVKQISVSEKIILRNDLARLVNCILILPYENSTIGDQYR